ncbi:17649_t:CDS:1, partial [Dentiscutata erythropus]
LKPQDLFDNNYHLLIEDYCRAIGTDSTELTSEQVKLFKAKALIDIEKYLIHFEKNLIDFNFDKLDYSLAGLTTEEINVQYQLFNDENYLDNELDKTLAKIA